MNSAKIVPFVDMQVEKPSTYKMIKNDGTEELVKLEFAPGIIYQEGTKNNAENFNTIQNNAVYRVDGTRVLEATEEIYDINIVNYNNYTPNDLTIIMNVDVSNTSNSPKIRLNNIKYNIVNESGNVPINFLINKNTFIFVLDFNKKTAKITSGDYKLKPATSSSIGGVKIGGSMTISADGTIDAILNQTTADGRYITNTSIGTYTTLFSGTQQCGQNTWKDTGIDIPTTYSSVLIGVNITNSGIHDAEIEFSRCTLTRGQTLLFAHQTQSEGIAGKIIGNRLWTYTSAGSMTDNNLKTVIGITRR